MKDKIKGALANTKLGECIVLNPFKNLNPVKDSRAATLTFSDKRRMCVSILPAQLSEKGPKATYLSYGNALIKSKDVWAGTCAEYACASIALVKGLKLVVAVELFAFGVAHSGHVFVVVNRKEDSTPSDPASWNDDIVVIDQWYANQKGKEESPVKDKGDQEYWAWLTNNGEIKRHASF